MVANLVSGNCPKPPTERVALLLLAKAIGKRLNIPVSTHCVRRVRKIPELKNVFDYDERLRLLDGAHEIHPSRVEDR